MERIASFCVDHDALTEGMYISRVDGDVVTYDLRFKRPNAGQYLSCGALHTIEHLFATYARGGRYAGEVLYFGPMGCRTGFYFLTRATLPHSAAIALTKDALVFICAFDGEIPGCRRRECGNYLEHDLPGAKEEAAKMLAVLAGWMEDDLSYPKSL